MANIKARRKLRDLYKRGVEVRFGGRYGLDGEIAPGGEGEFQDEDKQPIPLHDDEVAMWVQPPSPLQREQALRDAQASRARALVNAKRKEDSEEHLTVMAFLADMDDETLIEYVLIADADSRRNDATREVLADDEWKDISALQDAMRQFDEMSEEEREGNEEYEALMELDKKFGDQVRDREQELTDAARDVLKMMGRAGVEKKALDKRSEMVGSQAFMAEYERQMLFYAVREPDDHGVLFFESARELAEEDDRVREKLQQAMVPFINDVAEAKNSQGADSGSAQSEPPSEPETSAASTPETVSA